PTPRAAPSPALAPVALAPPVGPLRTPSGPRPPSPARLKVIRKRRRRRRTLIACTFLTTVCTFVTGVGYVYLQGRLDRIKRLDLAGLAGDTPGAVMNVLLVGSDTASGLDGAVADSFGQPEAPGRSTDTIMILHVDPRAQTAAIVSVPRDLYVPINGATPDRVNTAFATGGAERLIGTIRSALGVPINHYVQVGFSGFKDLIDAVGGLTLYVPYPVRDTSTGLAIDRAGCISVDGTQALSWARSRQTEILVNGAWQPDPAGDAGRIERQEDLVRRTMRKALTSDIWNPVQLNRVIGVGARDVTLDAGMSTSDLTGLGRHFSSLDPAKVALLSLPTNVVQILGKGVLTLQLSQAQPTLDLLTGKVSTVAVTTTVPAPAAIATTTTTVKAGSTTTAPATSGTAPAGAPKAADVRIRVLNGVGSPGAAAKAATSLTNLGFAVADKGDAPSISPKTTITYGTGQLAKAQLLQSALATTAVLKEDATLKAVDVNLVLGGDFSGVKSGIPSGGSAGSTTVAPAGSTTTVAPRAGTAPLSTVAKTPPC
ncbi:MAG: LCP family protein, partial [Actinomycetota bacterium]|nr:LCP family protein [Actinomycetota bacterium]